MLDLSEYFWLWAKLSKSGSLQVGPFPDCLGLKYPKFARWLSKEHWTGMWRTLWFLAAWYFSGIPDEVWSYFDPFRHKTDFRENWNFERSLLFGPDLAKRFWQFWSLGLGFRCLWIFAVPLGFPAKCDLTRFHARNENSKWLVAGWSSRLKTRFSLVADWPRSSFQAWNCLVPMLQSWLQFL